MLLFRASCQKKVVQVTRGNSNLLIHKRTQEMADSDTSPARKAAKPRVPSQHPTYVDMTVEAITLLSAADKKGASVPAIRNFITEKYKTVDLASLRFRLKQALTKAVEKGNIVQTKASAEKPLLVSRFKLNKVNIAAQEKAKEKKDKEKAKTKEKADKPTKKVATKKKTATKETPKKTKSQKTKTRTTPQKVTKAKAKGTPEKAVGPKAKAVAKSGLKTKVKTPKTPKKSASGRTKAK